MSSTFGGLNTVYRGLAAQQVSLDTVGHNISNANTDGYSRQTVNLATTIPEAYYGMNGDHQKGTGVDALSITRARDIFTDKQYWKESSTLGYGQTSVDYLSRIEGVFQEPSDTGVQTTMNKFWSAWESLAANPSGDRVVVRQRGVELADSIQNAARQLTDMVADTNSVLTIKVDKVNELSTQIYDLNRQIVKVEASKTDNANDLRDKRDLLVDQMSKLINVTVNEDKSGAYTLQSGGIPIVSGAGYQKLATLSSNDPNYGYEIKTVVLQGETNPLVFSGGEIRGLLNMRDSSTTSGGSVDGIKGYIQKLDKMSQFLLQDFNNIHLQGLGTDNSTGNLFFGDAATNSVTPYATTFTPATNALGWIAELKVNPILFNSANGLDKIAAKTAINNLTIQQSNGAGGAGSITSTYTGKTPLNYQVKLGSTPPAAGDLSAAGDVNVISVSRDNGATWTAVVGAGVVPKTFTLPGAVLPQTVTMQIASNTFNAVGDTYTFSVNQGNAAGNNAINLANSLKVTPSTLLGGATLDGYYSGVIGALGVASQSAQKLTENQNTLVNQVTNWRESVSGVNMDEELTNMIRFQKGYMAASRMITTMDEMFDKLINGTGIVGR